MKHFLLICTFFIAAFSNANDHTFWITTETEAANHFTLTTSLAGKETSVLNNRRIALMELDDSQSSVLSRFMHENYHRCGGFVRHDSLLEAQNYLHQLKYAEQNQVQLNYTLNNASQVNAMMARIETQSLSNTVNSLSAYPNRYYTQPSGIDAANWVKQSWQQLAANRSDISVVAYPHSWGQSSVIATIPGAEKADEIVIIGGHLDSINQSNPTTGSAPGSDDNASGIAVLSEALKAIIETNYKPQRTIQIIGYAAEEVGLRGSKAIASEYKSAGKNVVGVAQFDMTGNHGTQGQDIVMMTDYTNAAQNQFLQQLIETYLPEITYGYDQCGYGCSDHASWFQQGFPASMPFESRMNDINRDIHTINDTRFDAQHAAKFAKLAVAYLGELGKNAGDVAPPMNNKLQNGVTKTGLAGNAKAQLFFSLEVPSNASNLRFSTSGGTGDADLYVRYGQKPTLQTFDCKSTTSSSNETCEIINLQAGTYHIMVEAWNAISGVNLLGQFSDKVTPSPINQQETNLTVSKNGWLKRQIAIPAGMEVLTIAISGGSGDADLYVQQASDVSLSNYHCRPYKNGNTETCSFTSPNAGAWYIGLHGYQSATGVTLNITGN
ncbi:Bacterial leucyl aminopeptidase [Pseudoalteromonas luteoviolacea B = ATCC 29581]|nr:Bacterial leucyl aminopeptidase [Pseudoalteromonas luteoviolacea B = ATCC 29581]